MNKVLFIIIVISGCLNPIFSFSQLDKKDIIYDWNTKSNTLWIFIDSTFQKFTPSIKEIQLAKEISIKYVDSLESVRSSQNKKDLGKILDFNHTNYYRQFVGFIDGGGKKKIFINAICTSFAKNRNLMTEWIFVLDGGSCFYQVEVDLETKEVTRFGVDGEA